MNRLATQRRMYLSSDRRSRYKKCEIDLTNAARKDRTDFGEGEAAEARRVPLPDVYSNPRRREARPPARVNTTSPPLASARGSVMLPFVFATMPPIPVAAPPEAEPVSPPPPPLECVRGWSSPSSPAKLAGARARTRTTMLAPSANIRKNDLPFIWASFVVDT